MRTSGQWGFSLNNWIPGCLQEELVELNPKEAEVRARSGGSSMQKAVRRTGSEAVLLSPRLPMGRHRENETPWNGAPESPQAHL